MRWARAGVWRALNCTCRKWCVCPATVMRRWRCVFATNASSRKRCGWRWRCPVRFNWNARRSTRSCLEQASGRAWNGCAVRQGAGVFRWANHTWKAARRWDFGGCAGACRRPRRFRVYPNLLTERKNLAALFLNRGMFGLHARRQVGKGRDFEKLREYVPGDGYDEIHWKATAKRGRPITKVFQIERTQEVYVIIDASRLSARIQPMAGAATGASMGETTVLERFITAALVLGLAAEQQGDLFGLLTFADRVGTFVRARNGSAHYSACRDALYTLQPGAGDAGLRRARARSSGLRMRRRALLVVLTSLDDPLLAASFAANVDIICRQHLILVNAESRRRAWRRCSPYPGRGFDGRFVPAPGRAFVVAEIARAGEGVEAPGSAIFTAGQRTVERATGFAISQRQTKAAFVIIDYPEIRGE